MVEEDSYYVSEGELFVEDLNMLLANKELALNVGDFAKLFDQIIVKMIAEGRAMEVRPVELLREATLCLESWSVSISDSEDDDRYNLMWVKLEEIGQHLTNHPDIFEEFQYIPILRD